MNMSPKDGWTKAPEQTWVLAGGAKDPVLIYSLAGEDVELNSGLPAADYNVIWFDPRTGDVHPGSMVLAAAHGIFTKPDSRNWLLLLQPKATD